MAQTETKVLTAHIPLLLTEKVDRIAARLERSRGWIMKQALSAWAELLFGARHSQRVDADLQRLKRFFRAITKLAF